MTGLSFDLYVQRGSFELKATADLPLQAVSVVFGPSGSGKSTLLRALAGLENKVSGYIQLAGEVLLDTRRGICVPAHKRSIGYVPQESVLFPHLSVKENLLFGWRRTPPQQKRFSFEEIVEQLSLGHLLNRPVDKLSGGEKQRVALGRALLNCPKLLLLDEPVAALDEASKEAVLQCLEATLQALRIPTIYVTHSFEELTRLADYVAVLDAGRALAVGPVTEVLTDLNLPLCRRRDASTVLKTTVVAHDEQLQLTRLEFSGQQLFVPKLHLPAGTHLRIRIEASDVSLGRSSLDTDISIMNVIPVRVDDYVEEKPGQVLVRLVAAGKQPILSRITRRSFELLQLARGRRVYALIKSVAIL